jgi:hypothetical protein
LWLYARGPEAAATTAYVDIGQRSVEGLNVGADKTARRVHSSLGGARVCPLSCCR